MVDRTRPCFVHQPETLVAPLNSTALHPLAPNLQTHHQSSFSTLQPNRGKQGPFPHEFRRHDGPQHTSSPSQGKKRVADEMELDSPRLDSPRAHKQMRDWRMEVNGADGNGARPLHDVGRPKRPSAIELECDRATKQIRDLRFSGCRTELKVGDVDYAAQNRRLKVGHFEFLKERARRGFPPLQPQDHSSDEDDF
eukprot:TRINITY_DN14279_c0_g1_i5.p1 TRINITY_DN14279_c0_g1~~TRINITY_DN14279_c0_g1_i5.p1  ORF type:complete len:195 (+),score=7.43 TRINITY_DN14279_c0_g1_i5:243-827(+)